MNQPIKRIKSRKSGKSNEPKEEARWRYGELTIDDIVDAAASIVRREGIEGLTMRRLAKEVQVSPMAPYHYVSGKAEVLELLISRMLAPVHVPLEGTWKERLRETYHIAYNECRKYGGLVLESHFKYREGQGRRLTAEITRLLEDAGFQHDDVRSVELALSQYVIGFLSWESGVAHREVSLPSDLSKYFDDGLQYMLDGLELRLHKM